jgi:hypothetical protein
MQHIKIVSGDVSQESGRFLYKGDEEIPVVLKSNTTPGAECPETLRAKERNVELPVPCRKGLRKRHRDEGTRWLFWQWLDARSRQPECCGYHVIETYVCGRTRCPSLESMHHVCFQPDRLKLLQHVLL